MPVREFFKPKLEVKPVDISAYEQGNTGIPFVTTMDSGLPGPHVLVNALTHGNEICGAHTLDLLFKEDIRPVKGKLTLSFANVAAYHAFSEQDPFASRFVDEDFNRLWTPAVMHGDRNSVELTRARALESIVSDCDYLFDIHSIHLPSPPLLMCGMQDKSIKMGRAMGFPAHLVKDWGHSAGKRMRDYGAFDEADHPKAAMLVECGQHWARSSVEVAIETTFRFMGFCGVIGPETVSKFTDASVITPQRLLEIEGPVTIKTNKFRFVEDFVGLEVIPKAKTVIGYDGDEEILTPFDECVLLMPGRLLRPGISAVRLGRYVS